MRQLLRSRAAWIAPVLLSSLASAQTPAELERAGHVLRRVQYGAKLGDYPAVLPGGGNTQLTNIFSYLTEQITGVDATGAVLTENAEARNLLRAYPIPQNAAGDPLVGWSSAPPFTQFSSFRTIEELQEINLIYSLFSKFQLREKLTQLWQRTLNTSEGSTYNYFYKLFRAAPYGPTGMGWPHAQADPLARRYAAYWYWIQNDQFRANANGMYIDLLRASARSPSMLIYLNGVSSEAPKPDENYGREFLELHTCGPEGSWIGGSGFVTLPNYSYQDIQIASRIFSGWSIQDVSTATPDFQFVFKPTVCGGMPLAPVSGHYTSCLQPPPSNTMFAQTYTNPLVVPFTVPEDPSTASEGDALLMHMANSPATAEFVSRKLYRLLISEVDPPPGDPLILQCMGFWGNQGGNIQNVLSVLLSSPRFLDDTSIRWDLPRLPMEVLGQTVALFEGRGYDGSNTTSRERIKHVRELMEEYLGQTLFRFPSPDGFPTESHELLTTMRALGSVRFRQEMYGLFNLGTYPFLQDATGTTKSLGYDYINALSGYANFLDETSLTTYFTFVGLNNTQTGSDWGQIWNNFRLDVNGNLGLTLLQEFLMFPLVYLDRLPQALAIFGCHSLNAQK